MLHSVSVVFLFFVHCRYRSHFGWCAIFLLYLVSWLQVKFPIWDNNISESESVNKLGGKKKND